VIFQYQEGVSLFHRIDPLSKFIWLICISILALSHDNALGQMILFLATTIIGIFWAKMSLRTLWKGMRIPFWLGLPYFVLQLVFVSGDTELIRFGSFVISEEALNFSAAISLRLWILFLASLLFIATTDPRDVVLTLSQKLFVPYRFAYALSIALRFIPVLEAEAAIIRAAQKIRGLGSPKGLRNKWAWQKRFIISVFVSAVRRVEKTAINMELRGFGLHQERTYRQPLIFPPRGIALAVISVILTVAILCLQVLSD
jgi:energy-coupling factor transport system permease protein